MSLQGIQIASPGPHTYSKAWAFAWGFGCSDKSNCLFWWWKVLDNGVAEGLLMDITFSTWPLQQQK